MARFRSTSSWIPSRSSIVGSNYLSRLKFDSAGFKNFYRSFIGKRCGFSDQSMRIITAFTLQNSGGLDKGKAALDTKKTIFVQSKPGKQRSR